MIAGEKMDDILWLDEQESAEFEKILANLQPNRSTREEFMRIIAERYGEIISSEDSGFMFSYHEERIKVSFSSDGELTVMAKGAESEEWYILIYGVTAEKINDERNAAFMHYKIALMREIKLKN